MQIEHVAMWVEDLEGMKDFYVKFFGAKAGKRYHNSTNDFRSYFLSFDTGSRLELMQMPGIPINQNDIGQQNTGLIHLAISVGSHEGVDRLTDELRMAGYSVIGEPRTTGDGYYESVVLDPENNRIEITV